MSSNARAQDSASPGRSPAGRCGSSAAARSAPRPRPARAATCATWPFPGRSPSSPTRSSHRTTGCSSEPLDHCRFLFTQRLLWALPAGRALLIEGDFRDRADVEAWAGASRSPHQSLCPKASPAQRTPGLRPRIAAGSHGQSVHADLEYELAWLARAPFCRYSTWVEARWR
jgi:hypothetical protein